MWFGECWYLVISPPWKHYPVKFGVHRTFGIRDMFICHETICNHVIKNHATLCMVAQYHKPTLSSLLVMSHVKKEIKLFYLSRDYCIMWPLWVVTPYYFKFSRIWPRRWNITFYTCHVTSRDHVSKEHVTLKFVTP